MLYGLQYIVEIPVADCDNAEFDRERVHRAFLHSNGGDSPHEAPLGDEEPGFLYLYNNQ